MSALAHPTKCPPMAAHTHRSSIAARWGRFLQRYVARPSYCSPAELQGRPRTEAAQLLLLAAFRGHTQLLRLLLLLTAPTAFLDTPELMPELFKEAYLVRCSLVTMRQDKPRPMLQVAACSSGPAAAHGSSSSDSRQRPPHSAPAPVRCLVMRTALPALSAWAGPRCTRPLRAAVSPAQPRCWRQTPA